MGLAVVDLEDLAVTLAFLAVKVSVKEIALYPLLEGKPSGQF